MPLRFKKGYEDTEIHIPGKRLVINRYNLNDEYVQKILAKFPQFAHNYEPVPEGAPGEIQESSLVEEGTDEQLAKEIPAKEKPVVTKSGQKSTTKTTSTKGGRKSTRGK
jgi:hypothetical protein